MRMSSSRTKAPRAQNIESPRGEWWGSGIQPAVVKTTPQKQPHRFSKGDPNINRKGRPPGSIGFPDLLRRYMQLPESELGAIARDKKLPMVQRLAARQILSSLPDDDPRPLENLIDRVEGKPTMRQEVTGADGKPLHPDPVEVVVTYVADASKANASNAKG